MSSWCSWSCRCSWCSWSPTPNSCCSRAPRNRPRAARQRDGVRGERGVAGPRRGRIRPPGPASRANVLLRGAGRSPDTREKASPKPHGKAAVATKRSISYLYTFINRHGAGVLSPDAFPVYRRVAACAGCTGISGAHGPTVFPEPLHTLAEPGCELRLPREEVFSRRIPVFCCFCVLSR